MNDHIPPSGPVTTDDVARRETIDQGRLRAEQLAGTGASPVETLRFLLELLRTHGEDAGLLSDASVLPVRLNPGAHT